MSADIHVDRHVGRVSTATSNDIVVDIAVDITYSKHDPLNKPYVYNKVRRQHFTNVKYETKPPPSSRILLSIVLLYSQRWA